MGGQEGTRRTPCCSTAEQDGHWCRVIVTTGTVCRNREERTSAELAQMVSLRVPYPRACRHGLMDLHLLQGFQ